jgi:hypothetical protein
VRTGTRFEGELRVPEDEQGWPALIAKLLQRINRLGAGRSRGAGLVCVGVEQSTIAPPTITSDTSNAEPADHRILFEAIEPVALAATGAPGNLIRGHSHLSAAAVNGMLVRWAIAMGQSDMADLLLDHRIICGPAYPVPPDALAKGVDNIDVVPFPLSFQAPKPTGQAGALPWWCIDLGDDGWVDTLAVQRRSQTDGQRQHDKLKRPDLHDYLVRIESHWKRFRCTPGEAMRNDAGSSQRAPKKQELFAQEQVAEGTGFVARVVALDEQAESLLSATLDCLKNDRHWLQAGRGGAPVAVVGHTAAAAAAPSADIAGISEPKAVRLFVESDLILRTDELSFRTRLDRAAVLHLLRLAGASVDWLQRFGEVADSLQVQEVSEPTEVRGRNVATGGPRLPALAIRRGSEAMLRFADQTAADACRALLRNALHRGLGERSTEGLGRLRIDFSPACPSAGSVEDERAASPASEAIPLNPREALLEAASKWVDDERFPQGFTATRWQALRNAARVTSKDGLKGSLDTWFTQAKREAERLAERRGGGSKEGVAWLEQLAAELPKSFDARRGLLRTIGLLAAKQAAARRREPRRAGDARAAQAALNADDGATE